MKRDFNPVDVELSIENPSIERGAFYRMCFITESNNAPRTLKVTRLQDLLENGYSRLDLAYNFCVGVFSQQGMDTVYIRAKRSSESYVEAYNSDDNSMYYFVVLQTKDLTEIEKFNSHLVSSDEMKLQFFSQNIGSKILKSPKLVNYYQDFTLSGGVPVESKDYYLNKAYSGVTVVSKIPLPDYLLGGYGNTAVDYGVRTMVGKDYVWEIDKPNRQIKYARNVIESGWVGSREESTINNSEVTVVATKGSNGKLLRASIIDPKVKIETISSQLLKGLGKEVLDYAIPLIDPEAKDWELDAANNRVRYLGAVGTGGSVPAGEYLYAPYHVQNDKYDTPEAACTIGYKEFYESIGMTNVAAVYDSDNQCKITHSDGAATQQIVLSNNPAYDPDAPTTVEKYLPIDIVSQQVIANSESNHLESKEFLKSIPLFAYLLTGSGTEAVNKAVLDIDAEATDWELDPANNAIKYPLAGSNDLGSVNPAAVQAEVDRLCGSDGLRTFTHISDTRYKIKCNVTFSEYFLSYPNDGEIVPAPAEYARIPIDTVAAQVISNANANHAPSQEALRLSTVERVNIGEYDEALEAASVEIETSWSYLPIYDVAVQVKRNSIAGHAESIEAVNNSLPFELPNYEPNITITGIAKVGEILTATVTDANGVPSNINYQWYADGEVILDATSETYVIKESDSGKTMTVQADFTDKDGFSESVTGTVEVENVTTDMGLRADYSGSGWYKATDTGTVFNKGVPELETHVFSDSSKEYVSVYTKEDAKLYGERAAVSNITAMDSLFAGEGTFNEDLSSWDVSNVTSMEGMFQNATSFNFDMSLWDVSSVTDMNRMFYNATSFNQDLSSWCVTKIPTKPNVFDSFAGSWTLPRPVWGTCPSSSGGDSDTPWAYVPEETSVTGSTTTIKAKRTFENQRLKSEITVAASDSKVGEYLIKGGGSDALDYAVVELIGEGVDWVLEPDNNSVKYTVAGASTGDSSGAGIECFRADLGRYILATDIIATCNSTPPPVGGGCSYLPTGGKGSSGGMVKGNGGSWSDQCRVVDGAPPIGSGSDVEQYIPIDTVAAKVISNAESSHAPSQEAVKATALESFVSGEYDVDLDAAAVIDN